MELTELCKELNNWFELKKVFGTFTIENGELADDIGLLNGQYFRIIGSVFNDGVYQHPADELKDETFEGAVWLMAVPQSVADLLDEMNAWESKYGEASKSPYTSESFGGYSYSKSSGTSSSGAGNDSGDVLSAFSNALNRWRKV